MEDEEEEEEKQEELRCINCHIVGEINNFLWKNYNNNNK